MKIKQISKKKQYTVKKRKSHQISKKEIPIKKENNIQF